ncbi:hypothetical protein [Polaribacter sp. Hel1_85]|uniref:hypothetical protein n=1 Tax=Polaribacter sp. Hel1_85 TaxID=1250005 RepID=UPI00052D1C91|nr:hypothetical protein [Polaribacter sp. Hel1_85]KGL62376.1 hypothetical protein PHEL85_2170 [Polaribacter sp. Hel1_85]
MNRSLKISFLIVGIILIGLGIYTMAIPETQVLNNDVDLLETENNTSSYIVTTLGFISVALSLIKGKGKK